MREFDSERVLLSIFFFFLFNFQNYLYFQLVEHESKIASVTHYADCKLQVEKQENGKCCQSLNYVE